MGFPERIATILNWLRGGLRKHEKTQHVLVGLGSAALAAAAVALPG